MPNHPVGDWVPSTDRGRIVVAEDDRFYRQILAKRLQAAGHEVRLTANGEDAWEQVQKDPPELLLSDWMMPKLNGYDLCRRVKTEPTLKIVYCILLTAKGRTEDKVSALDGGADDYLLKPCEDDELLARVRTGLRIHRLHARLEEVSVTDSLTGLRNRRYFDQRLLEEVSRSRRYNTQLSLVMLDLDHFKTINDEHGHPTGDDVLAAVGQMLADRVRAGEVAARYGGDEFAVLLPSTSADGAHSFARDAEESLARLHLPARITVAGSAGWAELKSGDTGAELVHAADQALYERKQERKKLVSRGAAG